MKKAATPRQPWRLAHPNERDIAKRAVDLAIAIICLVALLPLYLLVALAIWLESGSPVLFTQERVGLRGRPFLIFKFRSMVSNAEQETGPVWAATNDARVTRLGAFLRRTHLDELPQFWNVLRGEMSVVGPRPERPVFLAKLNEEIPGFSSRCNVKPGITGLAQVRNGYTQSTRAARRKFRYDRHYIRNYCFLLDLKIMARTLWVLANDENAR
ncbi:MAG TPA: exopolysaccharide biosynthesis polyprenyl glycosylphosphotransferase [Candidatus Dormibacteraeota bacterium]|nr:exopolysaccharide biosynthesis polyprenyl glycosylphosphotransferase [Candidatus Dormibacteraeota bacterium]